jgi:predicted CopG family antitoxin
MSADSRLSILNVAQKCNIQIIKRINEEEFAARCPFCGDSQNPNHGHLMLNIAKDAYHCVRCGEQGYAIGLYARLRNIDTKRAYRELMELEDEIPVIEYKPTVQQNMIANIEIRDKVYRAFLSKLKLEKRHLQNLIRRGLSWQAIGQNMYKSVPQDEKEIYKICNELIKEGYKLEGIPGFYKTENNKWFFKSYPGFFIPVKDVYGRIQGMQIRRDEDKDKDKPKYIWFSSKGKPYGTPAHAWIGVSGTPSKKVIITEGPLKADISYYLSRLTFVSVPGITATKGIEQILKELGAQKIFIAFDMDLNEEVKEIVLKAREKLKNILTEAGFEVHIKEWDGYLGKGIDDYLLTLQKRKIKKVI